MEGVPDTAVLVGRRRGARVALAAGVELGFGHRAEAEADLVLLTGGAADREDLDRARALRLGRGAVGAVASGGVGDAVVGLLHVTTSHPERVRPAGVTEVALGTEDAVDSGVIAATTAHAAAAASAAARATTARDRSSAGNR